MRMIYSNADRLLVAQAQHLLQAQGFALFLKNEHAASIVGEVSAFDAWLELWLLQDSDYDAACLVLATAFNQANAVAWLCPQCQEENAASFELCWQCGTERQQS